VIDVMLAPCYALGDARELGTVQPFGDFQPGAVRLRLAVADELVGAEREGKRGEARVVRRIGKTIGTGGKQQGQAAGQEPVLVGLGTGLEAEQGAAHRAVRPRQQQELSGLRLELRGLGKLPGGRAKRLVDLRVGVGGHEPDRNRRGAGRNEGWMHEKSPKGRPASTTANAPEVAEQPD
jgi:hypothetical protein